MVASRTECIGHPLYKWLQVGLNVSGTHSIQDYPKQDDTAIGNIVLAARSIPSFYPVYERDLTTGEYLLDENGNRIYDYGNYRKGSYNGYNFAQSMLYDKKEYKRDAASIRGYLQITPLEGLSYKMSLNIDYNSRFAHFYDNPTYGKEPLTGAVEKENVRTTGLTYNNVINWNHTFTRRTPDGWSGILRIQHVQFWRFPYRCHYRRLLRTRCSFYPEFLLWQQRPIQIAELLR